MIGAIVVLLGGSITEITAFSWQSWLGAAVFVRLGVGLAQSILITFISEIAPFQMRGFIIGAYQLCLGFGQLIAAVATQLVVVHQPNKWKPLIATEFAFTAVSTPPSEHNLRWTQYSRCLRSFAFSSGLFQSRTSTTLARASMSRRSARCSAFTVTSPDTMWYVSTLSAPANKSLRVFF